VHRKRNTIIIFSIILALAIFAVWVVSPPMSKRLGRDGMSLGLDLKGGTHLVYQADLSGLEPGESAKDAIKGVRDIIERRVNAYGVSEPLVQIQGDNRISVQLPGIRNIEEAIELVGQTAQMDFREQKQVGTDENGNPVYDWVLATATDSDGNQVPLTGKYLKRNASAMNANPPYQMSPYVAFEFNKEGANLFEQITTRLIGKRLGIFLDNEAISTPVVNAVISDRGVIEGLESYDEAKNLAILLNEGALPVPLEGPIVREDIDPYLGKDSLKKSLIAGAAGFSLIILFVILYYRLSGVLASVSLIIYAAFVIAIFKLIPITLTLAGIAAFILSVGMAIDANVLIFERMKEELRSGKTFGSALEAGFGRAWPAIRDGNISTILICIILWFVGDKLGEPHMIGFGITLLIGILVSMFTAILVTRTFLRMLVGTRLTQNVSLFSPVVKGKKGGKLVV
jgi:preprotein translocase subunit SecD